MRIGILGIGAVGGYFGGRLADKYAGSAEVEVVFITRPATGKIIRDAGLKLITPEGEQIIHPHLAAWDAQDIGLLDVLICATKSYDLEESLAPLKSCIDGNTLVLPLLNGVDAQERIRSLYPEAEVLNGCVYIAARRIAPGVVKENGSPCKLFFGASTASADRLRNLQRLFTAAGIDSHLSRNIEADVWEKFLFNAGMATSTSYFDQTIGAVLNDPEHKEILMALVVETHAIARAKGIPLPDNIVEQTIGKMESLPYDATSSMHSDFQKGGNTEYSSLTARVAVLGDELGIETPTFDQIVADFEAREKASVA